MRKTKKGQLGTQLPEIITREWLFGFANKVSTKEASRILSTRDAEKITILSGRTTNVTIIIRPLEWLISGKISKRPDNLELVATSSFEKNQWLAYAPSDGSLSTPHQKSSNADTAEKGPADKTMLVWSSSKRLYGDGLRVSELATVNVSPTYYNLRAAEKVLEEENEKRHWLCYQVERLTAPYQILLLDTYNSRKEQFSGPVIQIGPHSPLLEVSVATECLGELFVSTTQKLSRFLSQCLDISAQFIVPQLLFDLVKLKEISKETVMDLYAPLEEIKCQLWVIGCTPTEDFYAMPFEIALMLLMSYFEENRDHAIQRALEIFSILRRDGSILGGGDAVDYNVKDIAGKSLFAYFPELTPEKLSTTRHDVLAEQDYAGNPEIWHVIRQQPYGLLDKLKLGPFLFSKAVLANGQTLLEALCVDNTVLHKREKLVYALNYILKNFSDSRVAQEKEYYSKIHALIQQALPNDEELKEPLDALYKKILTPVPIKKADQPSEQKPMPKERKRKETEKEETAASTPERKKTRVSLRAPKKRAEYPSEQEPMPVSRKRKKTEEKETADLESKPKFSHTSTVLFPTVWRPIESTGELRLTSMSRRFETLMHAPAYQDLIAKLCELQKRFYEALTQQKMSHLSDFCDEFYADFNVNSDLTLLLNTHPWLCPWLYDRLHKFSANLSSRPHPEDPCYDKLTNTITDATNLLLMKSSQTEAGKQQLMQFNLPVQERFLTPEIRARISRKLEHNMVQLAKLMWRVKHGGRPYQFIHYYEEICEALIGNPEIKTSSKNIPWVLSELRKLSREFCALSTIPKTLRDYFNSKDWLSVLDAHLRSTPSTHGMHS